MFKALIIDDEKPVRIAISKLGHWGYYQVKQPELSSNGREGLSIMREIKPDLVFVDMNMPIMDGCTFLKDATKEFPNSQFIVISGYDDFKYAQSAIHFGVSEYLLKPIDEDDLNQAIKTALQKIDPNITFESGDHLTNTKNNYSPDEVVDIIKEYIDNNYFKNFKMTIFEEKYFFSIEYLTKLFRSKYGFTMYDYLLSLRMKRAIELLEDRKSTRLNSRHIQKYRMQSSA